MFIDFIALIESMPIWHLVGLFVLGVLAFVISTISGGGGALILIPATSCHKPRHIYLSPFAYDYVLARHRLGLN